MKIIKPLIIETKNQIERLYYFNIRDSLFGTASIIISRHYFLIIVWSLYIMTNIINLIVLKNWCMYQY
jgi:hypothetical protein